MSVSKSFALTAVAALLVPCSISGISSMAQSIGTNLIVETFVGSAFQGTVDGQGTRSMFYLPGPLAIDSRGQVFCFQDNGRLRIITPDAVVTTASVALAGRAFTLHVGEDDALIVSSSDTGWAFVDPDRNKVTSF